MPGTGRAQGRPLQPSSPRTQPPAHAAKPRDLRPNRLDPLARRRIEPVLAVLAKARRRLWWQTAIGRLALVLAAAGLLLTPIVALVRLGRWPASFDRPLLNILIGLTILAAGWLAWQRHAWLATAHRLDALAIGHDTLATSLWLARGQREDGWATVQANAANRMAKALDLSVLLPWHVPSAARWGWLPVLVLVLAVWLPATVWLPVAAAGQAKGPATGVAVALPPGPAKFRSAAEVLGPDMTALLENGVLALDEILPQVRDQPTHAWLQQVRDVVQGVQDGTLDKRQAMELLAQLEAARPKQTDLASPQPEATEPAASAPDATQKAEAQRQQDQAVRDAVLRATEEAMKAAPDSAEKSAIAKALADKDLDALGKLASSVAEKMAGMKDAELDKWVKAFEALGKSLGDRKIPDQFKQLADRIDRLQKKRAAEGGLSHSDQERLQQNRHELQQLKKEHGDVQAAEHRVERLERGAKAAADEMRRQQQEAQRAGQSAKGASQQGKGGETGERKAMRDQMQKAMRAAADELRRESQDQQSRQAQRIGEARLRDVREALQRAGEQQEAQRSFDRRAGGQQQQERDQQGPSRLGQKGEQGEKAGKQGGKEPGQDGEAEQDGQGQAQGHGDRRKTQLGRGDLGDKSRWEEMREAGGQAQKGKGGQSKGAAGEGQGDGPGDQANDAKVKAAAQAGRTERLHGQQGAGPDTKKTFADAAKKGFAHQAWRQVFVEYSAVAEEMLDKEHLPAGRRALVLRYFKNIRPR